MQVILYQNQKSKDDGLQFSYISAILFTCISKVSVTYHNLTEKQQHVSSQLIHMTAFAWLEHLICNINLLLINSQATYTIYSQCFFCSRNTLLFSLLNGLSYPSPVTRF